MRALQALADPAGGRGVMLRYHRGLGFRAYRVFWVCRAHRVYRVYRAHRVWGFRVYRVWGFRVYGFRGLEFRVAERAPPMSDGSLKGYGSLQQEMERQIE